MFSWFNYVELIYKFSAGSLQGHTTDITCFCLSLYHIDNQSLFCIRKNQSIPYWTSLFFFFWGLVCITFEQVSICLKNSVNYVLMISAWYVWIISVYYVLIISSYYVLALLYSCTRCFRLQVSKKSIQWFLDRKNANGLLAATARITPIPNINWMTILISGKLINSLNGWKYYGRRDLW